MQLPSTRELKEKRFTQVGKGVAPWKAHKNGRGSKQGLWMGSTENTNVRSKFALQSEVLSLLLSQLENAVAQLSKEEQCTSSVDECVFM